jgi:hypothetical protein
MALDQVDVDKLDETGKEMSFLDHLEALRWHLFRSAIAICVGGGIVFFISGLGICQYYTCTQKSGFYNF